MPAIAVVATWVLVGQQALPAAAAWHPTGTRSGTVAAGSVVRPAAPTVTKVGAVARVSWTAVALSQGTAVTGYQVKRHVGATTTTVCTVSAPTVTCDDASPVGGAATYGVIATYQSWSSAESPTTSFQFDTTAPTTIGSASGTPNGAGWIQAASSTVTLTATDTESGVASIAYQVNGGSTVTVNAATASFAVATQGSNAITYAATDNAGNVESTKALTVKLDNVAPTVTTTFPPTGLSTSLSWNGNCRNSSNAVVNGLCGTSADASSGVTTVEYKLQRTLLGLTTCLDAGNATWTAANCSAFRTAAQGPSGVGSWYVALQASNLGIGSAYELRVRVTDAAGNQSAVVSPTQTFSVLV